MGAKPQRKKPYLAFVLPAMCTMVLIMIVPFLYSIWIVFNDVNLLENGGAFRFSGLANMKAMLADPRVYNALFVTVQFVVGSVVLELVLGLAISMLLDRKFFAKGVIRALIIIPMFMTPVVSGLVWRTFFDPNAGIISYLYRLATGRGLDVLGNAHIAIWGIILVDIWQWTPFVILLAMASLDGLPEDIVEAARMEGASELAVIRLVKLPMIKPTVLIVAILRAIDSLKAFDIIYVMTKGGPGSATETINMYAFTVGFTYFRIGYATAISFVFTFIVTIVLGKLIQHAQSI